jgi:hypothetical protein
MDLVGGAGGVEGGVVRGAEGRVGERMKVEGRMKKWFGQYVAKFKEKLAGEGAALL